MNYLQELIKPLNKKFKYHFKFTYDLAHNWIKINPYSKYIVSIGGFKDCFFNDLLNYLKDVYNIDENNIQFNNTGHIFWLKKNIHI